jgi:hypothetical protein
MTSFLRLSLLGCMLYAGPGLGPQANRAYIYAGLDDVLIPL